MPQNILEIIEAHPLRVKQLYYSAFRLADEELNLQVFDSSAVLLAIIKLGDTNASAKWLHSTGLTNETILRFIMEDFTTRKKSKQARYNCGSGRSILASPACTQSAIKMFNYLGTLRQGFRTNGELYIAHVLNAVAHSDSKTVERIFASVGLNMSDVRSKLNTPSIMDIVELYSRRY